MTPKLPPPARKDPTRRIVAGLRAGVEDLPIGAVAEEIFARRAENPKEIERAIEL